MLYKVDAIWMCIDTQNEIFMLIWEFVISISHNTLHMKKRRKKRLLGSGLCWKICRINNSVCKIFFWNTLTRDWKCLHYFLPDSWFWASIQKVWKYIAFLHYFEDSWVKFIEPIILNILKVVKFDQVPWKFNFFYLKQPYSNNDELCPICKLKQKLCS